MGEGVIVTKALSFRAVLFGACRIQSVGTRLSELSQSDLLWAERIFTEDEKKAFIAACKKSFPKLAT